MTLNQAKELANNTQFHIRPITIYGELLSYVLLVKDGKLINDSDVEEDENHWIKDSFAVI